LLSACDFSKPYQLTTKYGTYRIDWPPYHPPAHYATQVNERTGYKRRIRLIVGSAAAAGSSSAAAAGSSSAAAAGSSSAAAAGSSSAAAAGLSSAAAVVPNVTFRDPSVVKSLYTRPQTPLLLDFPAPTSGGVNMLPHYWKPTTHTPFYMGWNEIPLDSPIAKEVAYWYRHTLTKNYSHSFYLHSIQMNVDNDQFKIYQMKKQSFINKSIPPNERLGWHGTDAATTQKIMKNGFDRDFSRTGSQACGVGTYFAKQAAYSWMNGYCKVATLPDGKQQHFIILSRLLLGDYCQGLKGQFLKDRPCKADGTAYNSMVGYELNNPIIYVMAGGSDQQVYPEFVLEFRTE
jgi:hypothetical protein